MKTLHSSAAVGRCLRSSVGSLACSRPPATAGEAERETLENKFAASMSNVVLDGSFTVNRGGETHGATKNTLSLRCPRSAAIIWLFQARIQYGEHDVTVPVPVKLLWAGDTPVVSLTDASIPGLGTLHREGAVLSRLLCRILAARRRFGKSVRPDRSRRRSAAGRRPKTPAKQRERRNRS